MGGAASKKRKQRKQRKAAVNALKTKRQPGVRFSQFHDVTNLRGDVMDVVSDKEAARAVAKELRIPDSHYKSIRRLWKGIKKVKVERPKPKPSPSWLLMDAKRVKKIQKKYFKKPLERATLKAVWVRLFTGKGVFVKRTRFTDRMMCLFDEEKGFDEGMISEQQFVALVWNICSLNDFGVVDWCVSMFDLPNRNGILRCEVNTLVRMVHGVDKVSKKTVPGWREAKKRLPEEEEALIPKRALHTFITSDIGRVLLKPVYDMQAVLRRRARGNISWEELGHGRARQVRVSALLLRDLKHGRAVGTPAQVRFRANMVPEHFTQVGRTAGVFERAVGKASQSGLANKLRERRAMQYRREASGGASDVDMMDDDDDVGALPAEFMDDGDGSGGSGGSDDGDGDGDGDGSGDGDDDDDNDDADEGGGDADDGDGGSGDGGDDDDGEVEAKAGGDTGGDDAGESSDAKQAPSDDDRSAARSSAQGGQDDGPDDDGASSASGAASRRSKRSRRSRRDLRSLASAGGVSTVFSARAGEPDELPRPKSTMGQLSYPTVALTVKKRDKEQADTELALVTAWAGNRVVEIVDATLKARFKFTPADLERRFAQHTERRKRRYVRRFQTLYNYVTHSGETLLKDGEDLTSSEEEHDSDDSDDSFARKGITRMPSIGSVHISSDDSDDDDGGSGSDSDGRSSSWIGATTARSGRTTTTAMTTARSGTSRPRTGASVRFMDNGADKSGASVTTARSAPRLKRKMTRQQSKLALIDPESLEDAIRAATTLSSKLSDLKLPSWAAAQWGGSQEQAFLKAARKAAIGWAIVERWRWEKRAIPFMVRMRRDLNSIRARLHAADMDLEDMWELQYHKDVERSEARAHKKADEKVKMNVGVQAKFRLDVEKMLWVHKKWAKVDPRKADQPAMTKPRAMDIVREEFLAKEVMGAKDEVIRLYKQLRLQKRRIVQWLQDKAVQLSREDLAGVEDVMLDYPMGGGARG